jgi:two-component SAPR family response regulator
MIGISPAIGERTHARTELSGKRVLVIEDEAMVTMFLLDTLADIGCEIAGSASRFDDAMEKARSLPFDVAILDLNLDGRQTIPIAEAMAGSGVPFVFATGYGATSLPPSLRHIPVVAKPFQQHELERALLKALASSGDVRGRQETDRPVATGEGVPE